MPPSLTIACNAWASRRLSGLFDVIISMGSGVVTPASLRRDCALAGSCGVHFWTASLENSLFGEIGEQATVLRSLKITLTRPARSMAYSNACRTRGSFASGRSMGFGGLPDAVDVADVEGHALVAERLATAAPAATTPA